MWGAGDGGGWREEGGERMERKRGKEQEVEESSEKRRTKRGTRREKEEERGLKKSLRGDEYKVKRQGEEDKERISGPGGT